MKTKQTIKQAILEDFGKELIRLASLVGTDAKDPEQKLFDFISTLIDHVVEEMGKELRMTLPNDIENYSGNLAGYYRCAHQFNNRLDKFIGKGE